MSFVNVCFPNKAATARNLLWTPMSVVHLALQLYKMHVPTRVLKFYVAQLNYTRKTIFRFCVFRNILILVSN